MSWEKIGAGLCRVGRRDVGTCRYKPRDNCPVSDTCRYKPREFSAIRTVPEDYSPKSSLEVSHLQVNRPPNSSSGNNPTLTSFGGQSSRINRLIPHSISLQVTDLKRSDYFDKERFRSVTWREIEWGIRREVVIISRNASGRSPVRSGVCFPKVLWEF